MPKRLVSIVIALAVVIGCAGAQPVPDRPDVADEEPLQPGIWEVETGQRIEVDELIDELADVDYVIVGETHGVGWHHDVQNRIHRALTERKQPAVAAGLEMIERRFQPAVDDYLAGEIEEDQMLQRVEWDQRWGVDEEFYASIWRRARQYGQNVAALNAPRELVRQVGQVGIEGLDEEQRAQLPDIDRDNDEYRQVLLEIFSAHPTGEDEHHRQEAFERFYEAQLVWDESMARAAFEFMDRRRGIEQMVLLAGRGHVERGHGIPSRLVRRGVEPAQVVTVVPVSTTGPVAERMEQHRRLEYLQDEQISDYVWVEPEQ